jgi:hypothetical protein
MTKINLPKLVRETDLKYPGWKSKVRVEKTLTLHKVTGRHSDGDWFIANLRIGSGRGHADRTYATRISDGKTGFRIGKGPHVTDTITVYVTTKNKLRLAPLVAMADEGEIDANQIRDRISTRRAQGQLHRAAGRSSWRW